MASPMKHMPFFLLISILFLGCSARPQGNHHELAPQDGSLAHHDGTSPESLLLRAHEWDTDAVVKVVLGYLWGRDGFPRDPALADRWAFQANSMLDISKTILLTGLVSYEIYPALRSTAARACLEFSKDNPLARQLREDGIFDVDKCLEELPPPDAKEKKWIGEFKTALRKYQNFTMQCLEIMRDLLNKKATPKEMLVLAEKNAAYVTAFPQFAALLERDGGTPDIDLMRLVAAQQGANDALRYSGVDLLSQRLLLDTPAILSLFRKAHQHDFLAIRQMALNYEQGNSGFPLSPRLARAWRERGAYAGDAACQLTQAFPALDDAQSDPSSWAWATLAKEGGDARVQAMADWILQRIESRMTGRDLEHARDFLQEYREKIRLNLTSHTLSAH